MKKEVIYNRTNKLLTLILIITVIANGIQFYNFKSYERFDWTGSVISSKENIVQVAFCDFKGNNYYINKDKILDESWNEVNECEDNMKNTFLPDSLSITWFSYNEQKFYSGSFSLPVEIILAKATQMGMLPSIKNNYDLDQVLHFIAEVQPKGRLAVWIQKVNGNDKTKFKVATCQAKEIKTTWHIFDDYLETDRTSDISISKKVALVMVRHPYKLKVKLPIGFTLDDFQLDFFNQNNWYFNDGELQNTVFNFLPKGFWLKWGNGKKQYTAPFIFYEDEVLDFLRKENVNEDNSVPLVLELIVNNQNNSVKAIFINTATNFRTELEDKYESGNENNIIQLSNPYN